MKNTHFINNFSKHTIIQREARRKIVKKKENTIIKFVNNRENIGESMQITLRKC